jgi:MFS family permease
VTPGARDAARARLSVSASFFLFAAVLGNWAPRVPAIKGGLELSNGDLGLALFGLACGFVVGTRLAPPLIDRLGCAAVVRASTYALCVSLVGPALAVDLVTLTAALVLLGVLGGTCDVAINAQGVLVERNQRRPLMSGFHALWSVGAMVAGAIAAAAAGAGLSPRSHFAAASVVLLGVSLASLRWLVGGDVPRPGSTEPVEADAPVSAVSVLLLGLISFAAFIGEGSAADWSAVYLRDELGAPEGIAALGFTAFAGVMAASRFTADPLVARFGSVPVARAGLLVAASGFGLALAVDDPVAAIGGFALLGGGLGPVVPLAFSAAGNTGPRGSSRVLGRVVMMGYVGSIVGPAVIGFLAEQVGLRAALLLPVALAVVAAVPARRVAVAGVAPERMTT